MIDKAVILAAGMGNRLSQTSKEIPKPLLSLDGKKNGVTFLDYHLLQLSAAGIKSIYIVGNRATFESSLRAMESVKATWILNPTEDLSTSGSGHSAWFAWSAPFDILDGKSRVILMDADIVYDPMLLQLLDRSPGSHSKTLVCSDHRNTQEEVLVFSDPTDPSAARYHGKGLLGTKVVENCACLGEATGILLWEPHHHELLKEVTRWTIQFSTAKTRSEHEDITQRMMLLGKMRAVSFGAELTFMEVDTSDEYRTLVEDVYPKLNRLARGNS